MRRHHVAVGCQQTAARWVPTALQRQCKLIYHGLFENPLINFDFHG